MTAHRFLSVVLLLLLSACASIDHLAGIPPDQLFEMATRAGEEKDYVDAQEILDRIRDDHPFSRYAVEAELLGADLKFREEKYQEAAAQYLVFEQLHPTYPRIAYVIYQRGLCHWRLREKPGRDQTATRSAAEAFQKLLYGHPEALYAAKARDQLALVRSRLAAHELHVGGYYLRRKRYSAAIARLDGVVNEYPDTPEKEKALQLALEARAKQAELQENQ